MLNVIPLRRKASKTRIARQSESGTVKSARLDIPTAHTAMEMHRIFLALKAYVDEYGRSVAGMHRMDMMEGRGEDVGSERYQHQVKTRASGVEANRQINAFRKWGGDKKP